MEDILNWWSMHPYKRSARVSDLIRKEVADIIMHKLKDPRVGFITVTEAEVSDDLRHAMVHVSVLEEEKKEETLKILRSSSKFIRNELAKRIQMKFLPKLIFKLDQSIAYGAKMEKILNELNIPESESEDNENSV